MYPVLYTLYINKGHYYTTSFKTRYISIFLGAKSCNLGRDRESQGGYYPGDEDRSDNKMSEQVERRGSLPDNPPALQKAPASEK